jgi:hypothetical protein
MVLGMIWLFIWSWLSWGFYMGHTSEDERYTLGKWLEAAAWVDGLSWTSKPISYVVDGKTFRVSAERLRNWDQALALRDEIWARVKPGITSDGGASLVLVLLVRAGLTSIGRRIRVDRFLRGGRLVPARELRRLIRRAGPRSILKIAGVRIGRDSECQHIQILGTTGVGKSVAFQQLINSAASCWASVIYDTKGEFLANGYDPERDVVLNALDARCPAWTPWDECLTPTDIYRVAKSLVAGQGPNDSYWIESARQLLADLLLSVPMLLRSNAELYRLCTTAKTAELSNLLAGTPSGRLFADDAADRMRESVRNTLATSVRGLQLLKPDAVAGHGFSITRWVRDAVDSSGPKPRVFLVCPPDHAPAAAPIIAAWIEAAAAAILGLGPSRTRRVLFAIDELPTLPALDYLKRLAAEGRGYGASIIVAAQSHAQLRERYGADAADSLTALFSTHLLFRAADSESADRASKLIGDADLDVARETESTAGRDSLSVSSERQSRRLVTPTELLQLPNLQCFIRVAGDFPVARLRLTPPNTMAGTASFVPRDPATLIHRPAQTPHIPPMRAQASDDQGPL